MFSASFFSSCSRDNDSFESLRGTVVGQIKNGELKIVADHNDLLLNFEQLANYDGVKIKYTSLELKKMEDDSYALFAFSEDYLTKSAISLSKDNNTLKIKTEDEEGGSITCVTTGCSNSIGCTPVQETVVGTNVKVWVCSKCSADCKKTTTVDL